MLRAMAKGRTGRATKKCFNGANGVRTARMDDDSGAIAVFAELGYDTHIGTCAVSRWLSAQTVSRPNLPNRQSKWRTVDTAFEWPTLSSALDFLARRRASNRRRDGTVGAGGRMGCP